MYAYIYILMYRYIHICYVLYMHTTSMTCCLKGIQDWPCLPASFLFSRNIYQTYQTQLYHLHVLVLVI